MPRIFVRDGSNIRHALHLQNGAAERMRSERWACIAAKGVTFVASKNAAKLTAFRAYLAGCGYAPGALPMLATVPCKMPIPLRLLCARCAQPFCCQALPPA
ncbi:hypothetical protein NPIL_466841 [Nephila pilipes]|uniref:Uncharacterized protein n=1 Tax=Nephila pilipes TaxID=299642 RepID=A0A8X6U7M3_NEPPI|nr:hypothetical protein NPIL_466841 [Nephila pilipes]